MKKEGPTPEQPASLLSLVFLWLVLVAIGLADACLVTYIRLPPFFCTAVHGTLVALLGANAWALQRDLDRQNQPVHEQLKTERMQTELITRLSLNNMVLERQNKILTSKLNTIHPHPKSKSCSSL